MVRVPAHLRAPLCAQGQEESAIVFLHLSSLRYAGPCRSRCRATWPHSGYRGFDFPPSVRPCSLARTALRVCSTSWPNRDNPSLVFAGCFGCVADGDFRNARHCEADAVSVTCIMQHNVAHALRVMRLMLALLHHAAAARWLSALAVGSMIFMTPRTGFEGQGTWGMWGSVA